MTAAVAIALLQGVSTAQNKTRAELEDYFRKAAGLGFSGAVLVENKGQILLRQGYGWADVKRKVAIRPNTIFDIGSGTKAFTATAIMQLEERGKLNTADLMSKYIKDVPPDKADITIYHLLTHTSGLNFDYFYDQATAEQRDIMADRDRYVRSVLGYPLAFKPGEGRVYSNTGFSLLAVIIEIVSGRPYEQYVRENLFKSAGMTETGYYIPRELRRVARGYNDGDTDFGYPWETQWRGKQALWDLIGNGGMLTTLDDVHKWMTAIKLNKIVSKETREKMVTPHPSYRIQAYGWNVGTTESKQYFSREGDAVPQAWNVEFRYYPDDDLIAIVLANRRVRAGSVRRYAMSHMVNIALFDKPPELPAFIRLKKHRLNDLAGTYKLESGASFNVTIDERATGHNFPEPVLSISATGQQAIDLLYSGARLPDVENLAAELNERATSYFTALQKNDLATLRAILPSGSSTDEAIKRWNESTRGLKGFEILGTTALNQPGAQTFVRLNFVGKSDVYKVTWRDKQLSQQAEDRLQPELTSFLRRSFTDSPLTVAFLPRSNSAFSTYDLVRNRTVAITFGAGTLTVHAQNGDVVARKAGRQSKP